MHEVLQELHRWKHRLDRGKHTVISALAVFPFPNNNNELEASYLHTDGSRFLFCGGYTVKHVTDAHFPASKHNLKITLWRVELQQCV